MKKIASCLIIGFLLFKIGIAEAKLFGGEEFFLDNGMQVIVVPNHKAPIIKHMVFYKVGSIDEPLGKGGLAHLLEHLMFRGTSKIKGNRLNELLEENGAESNAFTATDMTAYHQALDISRLELAMFLEADRMQNLKLTPKDFELERGIVYQERKQMVENNPLYYFNESLRRVLWQNHPYSRPITGTVEEINSLTLEDAQNFYNKYYAPNNAVLVLSGDIDVPTAKELAQKYYGNVKAREIGKRVELPKLEDTMKARLEMSREQIGGMRLSKAYAAPSYNHNPEDIYNLEILSGYLGEGETSKLYKKLVLEQKTALAVSTSYDANSRSYGTFTISVIPAPGLDADKVLASLDAMVNEALQEINIDEVEKVKGKMLAGLVYLKDNPNDAAYLVGSAAASGMKLADIEMQAEKLKQVDYQGVKKAAERLFENSPQVVGILKPKESK